MNEEEYKAWRDAYQHEENMKEIMFINENKDSQKPSPDVIRKMRSFGYIYKKPVKFSDGFELKGYFRKRKVHYHAGEKYRHITEFKRIEHLAFDTKADAERVAKEYMLIWNKKEHIRERLQRDLEFSKYGQKRPTIKLLQVVPEYKPHINEWVLNERYLTVKIPIKRLREKKDIIIGSKSFTV